MEAPNFKGSVGQSSKTKMLAAVAAILIVGGGITAFAVRGGGDASPETSSAAEPTSKNPAAAVPPGTSPPPAPEPPAASKTEKEESAEESGSAPSTDGELYAIEEVNKIDGCEQVLEKPAEHYEKLAKWRSAQAWKLARKYLMQGKNDLALEQMCQSALIDPKGQAIAGLVNYFLRHRAIDQAHVWAQKGLEAAPQDRGAKEGLGDVLSQLGRLEEARRLWLETVKLSEDQSSKIAAVARTWVKAAQKANRAGDTALAERLLRRAAAFQPDDAETAAEMAAVLSKNEQPKLAKNWAKKALELDGESELAKEVLEASK